MSLLRCLDDHFQESKIIYSLCGFDYGYFFLFQKSSASLLPRLAPGKYGRYRMSSKSFPNVFWKDYSVLHVGKCHFVVSCGYQVLHWNAIQSPKSLVSVEFSSVWSFFTHFLLNHYFCTWAFLEYTGKFPSLFLSKLGSANHTVISFRESVLVVGIKKNAIRSFSFPFNSHY